MMLLSCSPRQGGDLAEAVLHDYVHHQEPACLLDRNSAAFAYCFWMVHGYFDEANFDLTLGASVRYSLGCRQEKNSQSWVLI